MREGGLKKGERKSFLPKKREEATAGGQADSNPTFFYQALKQDFLLNRAFQSSRTEGGKIGRGRGRDPRRDNAFLRSREADTHLDKETERKMGRVQLGAARFLCARFLLLVDFSHLRSLARFAVRRRRRGAVLTDRRSIDRPRERPSALFLRDLP